MQVARRELQAPDGETAAYNLFLVLSHNNNNYIMRCGKSRKVEIVKRNEMEKQIEKYILNGKTITIQQTIAKQRKTHRTASECV